MDTVAHIIYEMAIHRFALMAASAMLLPIALFGVALALPKGGGQFGPWIVIVAAGLVVLSLINIFAGSSLATNILYDAGEKGAAMITATRDTGSQYNNQHVWGHNVLIRTSEDKVVESYFEDDYFLIYPSSNEVRYPGPNITFTVHYLRSFPQDFVIVSDDDSPWALLLRCSRLGQMLNEARTKYAFDPASGPYRQTYVDSIHHYIEGKCYSDEVELQAYRRVIENVNAEVK